MPQRDSRLSAAIALLLIVAAANLGLIARLYGQAHGGQAFFVATRVWILLLPGVWVWRVDRDRCSWAWPTRQELGVGLWLGLGMFAVIYGGYLGWGQQWLDGAMVRDRAAAIGLLDPWRFLAFAIYFTLGNALVEEYIWRWFVYRKCEVWVSGVRAVGWAALLFTLHHIVALVGFTGSWPVVWLGAIGVFVAGAIWSECYLAYRSLWACYISHALADLAIAIVAWQILFP